MKNNLNLVIYFNSLSEHYSVNKYASFYLTNYMRRKLIKKIKKFQNKSVLDIMSGKGENLKYINQQNETKITTIDFANKMNNAAKINNKRKKIHQIENDFFRMNHISNSYDIILCSYGLKTIDKEDLQIFSKKIQYILKPDGELVFLEMVKPKKQFIFKILEYYLNVIIPKLFGNRFKALFPFVESFNNMKNLKQKMIEENLKIIDHKRYFDLFEIIHAKKIKV